MEGDPVISKKDPGYFKKVDRYLSANTMPARTPGGIRCSGMGLSIWTPMFTVYFSGCSIKKSRNLSIPF